MHRSIGLVIVLVLATSAAADPNPTRLSMKRIEGTNLHIANQGGAINWRADIGVTIDLQPDQKLAMTAKGTRGEHNLYGGPSSRSTDEDTAWTTRWSGTWAIANGKLGLDLTLVDRTCKSEKKMTEFDATKGVWLNYTPEVLPCKTASKRTRLECTAEKLELRPTGTGAGQKVDAWRCNAKTSSDLAETPSQLVFGKTACIQTSGGKMSSEGFALCPVTP